MEISTYFDDYIQIESIENNYVERLSYDFEKLKTNWKKEMLGEDINGR